MRLTVVGNGSTATDKQGRCYVNSHTGEFLLKLASNHDVQFLQFESKLEKDCSLMNFNLYIEGGEVVQVRKSHPIKSACKILRLVLRSEFVYLFFPGTLSRIVGMFCLLLRKEYGLYVRGQDYDLSALDRMLLKRARMALTVSPAITEKVKNYCAESQTIRPMISVSRNQFNVERNFQDRSYIRLLYVGRVEYRKGIFDLIDMTEILVKEGFNFQLDVVGGGADYTEVKRDLVERNLAKFVSLKGLVSDAVELRKIYDNSDAFVFLSHDEGFPRVLYEAMASKLPIFTTFVGGIPGRMVNKVNCFEVPVKSPELSASILLSALSNYSSVESVAASGQKTLDDILAGGLLPHDEMLNRVLGYA